MVYGFISIREANPRVSGVCVFMLLLRAFFFCASALVLLYILLEIITLPLVLILLGFGSQVQKIQASYYIIMYSGLRGLPFI